MFERKETLIIINDNLSDLCKHIVEGHLRLLASTLRGNLTLLRQKMAWSVYTISVWGQLVITTVSGWPRKMYVRVTHYSCL